MTPLSEIELKPCPFCGKEAHIYKSAYPNGETAYNVCCLHYFGCYLENAIDADFETSDEAAEAWNGRVDNG